MTGGEGKRCGATAGVPGEMERLPAAPVGLTEHPGDFGIEAVIARRLRIRVHLEVFGYGVSIRSKRREERAIGRFRRKHAPRQEDRPKRQAAFLSHRCHVCNRRHKLPA